MLHRADCGGQPWGAANARVVRTTRYDVTVDKAAGGLDSLNIVLAADLHLGYNIGCRQMERMVRKINAEDPGPCGFRGRYL